MCDGVNDAILTFIIGCGAAACNGDDNSVWRIEKSPYRRRDQRYGLNDHLQKKVFYGFFLVVPPSANSTGRQISEGRLEKSSERIVLTQVSAIS